MIGRGAANWLEGTKPATGPTGVEAATEFTAAEPVDRATVVDVAGRLGGVTRLDGTGDTPERVVAEARVEFDDAGGTVERVEPVVDERLAGT